MLMALATPVQVLVMVSAMLMSVSMVGVLVPLVTPASPSAAKLPNARSLLP
jgi:hypothetical protein